jgi:hypothetical protein
MAPTLLSSSSRILQMIAISAVTISPRFVAVGISDVVCERLVWSTDFFLVKDINPPYHTIFIFKVVDESPTAIVLLTCLAAIHGIGR